MKSFVCLALSCLLIGLLYVYMRQQFAAQAVQIEQLRGLVRSIANEIQVVEPQRVSPPTFEPKVERLAVSDDSESEEDDCSSDGETDDETCDGETLEVTETLQEEVVPISVEEVSVEIEVSETKSIQIATEPVKPKNLEKLTLKELKDLAVGAPASVKTKKDLIAFIEKI